MKLKYFRTAFLFVSSLLLFASCEEKLPTEFGNSTIYFSTGTYTKTYRGLDSSLVKIALQPDTTTNVIGVYRSGIVDNLEEITITLQIDSAYLDSIIAKAQTLPAAQLSDLMTKYKNSKALGGYYFSIPEKVTIPQGQRSVAVPLTYKKSLVKLYNNSVFNYTTAMLIDAVTPKDRMLVFPVKIVSTTSSYPILENQRRFYFQVMKIMTFKAN